MSNVTPKITGRSIMAQHAKPAHKATARMLGYADGYLALADLLALRLSDQERAWLAYAALRAMGHGTACTVADAALGA